jgi:sugar/nucleoside kinase (ribokinase family)
MSASAHPQLVVVGSVGIDTIETPAARRESILGGSASYACVAASFFTPVGMVGVVGSDFPAEYRELYRRFGVDLEGLQTMEGQTFRWSGVYQENMDQRDTLCTDLNVFAFFSPKLPERYRHCPFVFLANIGPELQLHVLEQVRQPRFVVADTMDLWINTAHSALLEVVKRVNLLTLNEHEARHLSHERNLVRAAGKLLAMGPQYVMIKKGEHGSVLFSRDRVFLMPAFPLDDVQDPTGAGDCFAGGFIGYLAEVNQVSGPAIHQAMLYGSVVASFGVEAFSLDRLRQLQRSDVDARAAEFRRMIGMG